MGISMKFREATANDIDAVLECIIDFWKDRNHTDYDVIVVKDFLKETLDREYKYFCVAEEKNKIVGGQISTIFKHPFSNECYASEAIWFTSPHISKFKRIKAAYGVLKGLTSFMKKNSLKRMVNHLHSVDGDNICSAANKLLKKMGYKLLYQQYVKEI
tara:strand:- start:4479 stop:4952 length:474 start_codon:yes stop_codon:yes gene_type:complete